jgi:hypothetical protein
MQSHRAGEPVLPRRCLCASAGPLDDCLAEEIDRRDLERRVSEIEVRRDHQRESGSGHKYIVRGVDAALHSIRRQSWIGPAERHIIQFRAVRRLDIGAEGGSGFRVLVEPLHHLGNRLE